MSMKYIRDAYGVPAKRGMWVEAYYRFRGQWRLAARGRITSAINYIHVNGVPLHPTKGVVYYGDDGEILCDTRKETP